MLERAIAKGNRSVRLSHSWATPNGFNWYQNRWP